MKKAFISLVDVDPLFFFFLLLLLTAVAEDVALADDAGAFLMALFLFVLIAVVLLLFFFLLLEVGDFDFDLDLDLDLDFEFGRLDLALLFPVLDLCRDAGALDGLCVLLLVLPGVGNDDVAVSSRSRGFVSCRV